MAAHEEDDKLHLHMAINMTAKLEDKTAKLEEKIEDMKDKLDEALLGSPSLVKGELIKFKFTDYQKSKDQDERVESPSYYTSRNGYHMTLRVYANGDGSGKGTHVSVYAPILKGRYDAELKWPFIGKITCTLLNQLADKNHHLKILNMANEDNTQAGGPAWGYGQFIPHSKLGYDPGKNTQYLKDDTLYFRMSVELPRHDKPWLE